MLIGEELTEEDLMERLAPYADADEGQEWMDRDGEL